MTDWKDTFLSSIKQEPYYVDSHGIIYCGDCLEIMPQVPEGYISLYITSPPYWKARDYECASQIGYGQSYREYIRSLENIYFETFRTLIPGGRLVIVIGEIFHKLEEEKKEPVIYTCIFKDIVNLCLKVGFRFAGKVLWCKGTTNENLGIKSGKALYGSYPYPPNLLVSNTTENILIFRKPGHRTYKDVSLKIAQSSKLSQKFIHEFTRPVWYINPRRSNNHPAVFPGEIPSRFIKAFTFVGDLVGDFFSGEGTSCEQAKKIKRNYLGIEINPSYCLTAKKRLSQEGLFN